MYNLRLHFHFTGIGGSGMAGIAEILLNLGFRVSGSDLSSSPASLRLARLGAKISQGHSAAHLSDSTSLLVYSSAVAQDNPEIVEARRRNLPVVPRAEVLAELLRLKFGVAVAGSHGKTTTTSMIASVLESAGLDPTVIIGGLVRSIGSGGKLGKGDFLVAESDESDRSFLLLRPSIAVVTNIDAEHISAYGSMAELEKSFESFIKSVPFYGLAVLCVDDPRVRDLAERCPGRKITYGLSPDAQIRAGNITHKESLSNYVVSGQGFDSLEVALPMPGRHMVQNSLAAFAVGQELNIEPRRIKAALENFAGVGRRLDVIGEPGGVLIINDYGHHPTEVKATIEAVRAGWLERRGLLHVVFQPHRYTRTRDCFAGFLGAFSACDELIITDIYAAGEKPLDGVSAEALCEAISHPRKTYVRNLDDVLPGLTRKLKPGDTVICLGAGSIGGLSEALSREIDRQQH